MKDERLRERVFDLLAVRDMSVYDAKRELNISHNAFYQWKSDNISFANLLKLANFFDCSLEYLLGRSDEPTLRSPVQPLPDFNKRLTELLKKRNISIYQLALNTTISYSNIYRWKKGERPTVKSLIAIADYLGVTLDYLIGREF